MFKWLPCVRFCLVINWSNTATTVTAANTEVESNKENVRFTNNFDTESSMLLNDAHMR